MSAQTYKELHAEKNKLEVKETLATVRQVLQLVRACANKSVNFQDFTLKLDEASAKIEKKMDNK